MNNLFFIYFVFFCVGGDQLEGPPSPHPSNETLSPRNKFLELQISEFQNLLDEPLKVPQPGGSKGPDDIGNPCHLLSLTSDFEDSGMPTAVFEKRLCRSVCSLSSGVDRQQKNIPKLI